MFTRKHDVLTIIFLLFVVPLFGEQIWIEKFLIPGKGIWGDTTGVLIHSDFTGITNWHLDYSNVKLASAGDYAKTVGTNGGRFEICDIDGEVVWISESLKIKGFGNVSIQLSASETGSSANEAAKYLKVYFRLDNGVEILFNTNGRNAGNWGSTIAIQSGLNGDSLRIIVRMANSYSSDKVILDDIIVSGEVLDNQPPFITGVTIVSPDSLELFFNEPLLSGSASKEKFKLFSDSGQVLISGVSGVTGTLFRLLIQPPATPNLILTQSGISDLAGNISVADTFAFLYLPPVHPNDVVINEIMADPSPPQGLPDAEFIELYNRAAYPINLKNWLLDVDDTERSLGEFILLPNKYVIFASSGSTILYTGLGDVLPVTSFPALINSGSTIRLLKEKNKLIDEIQYTSDWPLNIEKTSGGWSLERIDPNRFCGQANNWQYSINPKGGTPGKENSVKAINPDIVPPRLVNIEAISSSILEIEFNEPITSSILGNNQSYLVSDGIGQPDSVKIISSAKAVLHFSKPFSEDKTHNLTLSGITDECGNAPVETIVAFTWSVARNGDLVINEILSNPSPAGTDFVELFNPSGKSIHLSHLLFSNGNDTIRLISSKEEAVILKPGGYIVCTKDSAKAALPYPFSCREKIVTITGFPSVYNDEGSVAIFNEDFEEIDRVIYSRDLYTPFLTEIEGISLERISTETPSNNPLNWMPAAESVGFATPGCENSQAGKGLATSVTFEPESFSPNNDGYNDEYRINYQLRNPGYIGNAWIYDVSGRLIFQLAKNEILATDGFIKWNGQDETGSKLPVGVYVVVFEIFDIRGNILWYKDAVVLTDILE